MTLKSFVRAVTPPVVWDALKRIRGTGPAPTPGAQTVPQPDHIMLGYVRSLEARFPRVAALGLPVTAENAPAIAGFYSEVIPLYYEEPKPAHLRNALFRLERSTNDPALLASIRERVAIIEVEANRDPDRATVLRGHSELGPAWKGELEAMEAAYGGPIVSEDWSGADRGAALIYYFSAHPAILRGKRVLHMAAEANLRDWILENAGAASYRTSDAYGSNADEAQDITAISHPDNSFDLVICHRVMEHVLDDAKGFSELYRILKPGGFVSFSVPQAPHNPKTAEWSIPDLTHHGHVRHYGADLEDRMRAAGFRVELVPWLLTQKPDLLRAKRAFPMRIFHLHKA
jgi:SAM-dependent methyltransferase